MTSATTRKVLKLMPPVGVKIKLVSTAGAAGMTPPLLHLERYTLGVHCLGLDFSFTRAIIKQTVFSRHIYYMKYFFLIIIVLFCLFNCASNEKDKNHNTEGITFCEGAAMGYRGIIRLNISMQGGTITDITVLESYEDMAVGRMAIEELIDLVLMYNTTEIDAVSGATETSRGFLDAVENAITN